MLSLQRVSDPVYVAPNEHVQSFGGSADADGRFVNKGAKPKGNSFEVVGGILILRSFSVSQQKIKRLWFETMPEDP